MTPLFSPSRRPLWRIWAFNKTVQSMLLLAATRLSRENGTRRPGSHKPVELPIVMVGCNGATLVNHFLLIASTLFPTATTGLWHARRLLVPSESEKRVVITKSKTQKVQRAFWRRYLSACTDQAGAFPPSLPFWDQPLDRDAFQRPMGRL
jgi:hypothetical protein